MLVTYMFYAPGTWDIVSQLREWNEIFALEFDQENKVWNFHAIKTIMQRWGTSILFYLNLDLVFGTPMHNLPKKTPLVNLSTEMSKYISTIKLPV